MATGMFCRAPGPCVPMIFLVSPNSQGFPHYKLHASLFQSSPALCYVLIFSDGLCDVFDLRELGLRLITMNR